MPKYMTRQRKILLDYLSEHTGEALCPAKIIDALAGENISMSAIYRNLADLEKEGKLKRYTKPGSTEVYYRYADAEPCRGHLHLSCVQCGRTVHMEQEDADRLAESLAKTEGFALNCSDTVLYGLCSKCRK